MKTVYLTQATTVQRRDGSNVRHFAGRSQVDAFEADQLIAQGAREVKPQAVSAATAPGVEGTPEPPQPVKCTTINHTAPVDTTAVATETAPATPDAPAPKARKAKGA